MAEERVQKILARAGYGSRRASEELITAGRVRINGQVAVLGSKADPTQDTITVDQMPIAREQPPVYVAVNKPQGVLSEVSPEEPRDTVRDLVPLPGHLFIVGRLDMDSEGLILLTNDGELANQLTHPRYGHEKEYRVLVASRPDERQLEAWRHGIVLEDGYRTAPSQIRIEATAGKGVWLRVILREGRKRQIREMGKQIGLLVQRIQRIRIGSLLLGEMRPGQWRELRPDEVRALKVNKPYRENDRPRPSGGRARPSGERARPTAERSRPARGSTRPDSDRPRRDRPGGGRSPEDHPPAGRRTPGERPRRETPGGAGRAGPRPPRRENQRTGEREGSRSETPRPRTRTPRRGS